MGVESWSTTAASNNSASPNGAPEGMAPSGVNDTIRQNMASVRTFLENAQWFNFGYTHTYSSGTVFTIASTDYTSTYSVGRRIKAVGSSTGTIYGTIITTSYSSSTTVTVSWDSGSLSNESLTVSLSVLTNTNSAVPYINKQAADVASATTIDLNAIRGELVDVTGTTTITTITLAQGHTRIIRFTGILTFTHGASLVLPTSANITTVAGDYAIVSGYASSVVRCVGYFRADGTPLTSPTTATNLTVSGKFSFSAASSITAASGGLTVTESNHIFEGEGAASDDITDFAGGVDGQIVEGSITDATHILTFKHGSGNILCEGNKDIQVANTAWQIRVKYRASDTKYLVWVVNNKAEDLLDIQTASATAAFEFKNLSNAYSAYKVKLDYILPTTSGKALLAKISTDNGANYIGANYQVLATNASSASAVGSAAQGTTQFNITGNYDNDVNWGIINTSTKGACGEFIIYDPANASHHKIMESKLRYYNAASAWTDANAVAQYTGSTTAINAFEILFDSNTISSGVARLYGIR